MGFILLVEEGSATQVSSIGVEFVDGGAMQTVVGLRKVTFEFEFIDGPSDKECGDRVLGDGFVVATLIVGYRENLFGIIGRGVGK